MDLLEQLKAPFPADKISWRVGATNADKTKGIALAYIDARDVMRRFDEVCGMDWQCNYSHVTDKGVVCNIGILIAGEWRWRANGAGETDVEGEKGAMSDAFKRAGVLWGVGRYLYDLPNVWVPLEAKGRSHVITEPPKLPQWAIPQGEVSGESPMLGEVMRAIEKGDEVAMYVLSKKNETDFRQAFGRLNMKQKAACRDLEQKGSLMVIDWAEYLRTAREAEDADDALAFLNSITDPIAKRLLWAAMDPETQHFVKKLKEAA